MTKTTLARNAACDAVTALVDQSSTPYAWPAGRLCIYDASSALVARLPFSCPAFQAAVDGTALANPITDSTVYADATVAWFAVVNRDQTCVWTGTIQKSSLVGGDMKFDSLVFPKDSTVTISSANYSVPA